MQNWKEKNTLALIVIPKLTQFTTTEHKKIKDIPAFGKSVTIVLQLLRKKQCLNG